MPELPEIETTRRGLLPHAKNTVIHNIIIRQPLLRWPVPPYLNNLLSNRTISDIKRRGKYLLFEIIKKTSTSTNIKSPPPDILAIHLGMSGNLRITHQDTPLKKHDHVDICLNNNKIIRYNDARRFGAIFWIEHHQLDSHSRFKHLGPEPLTPDFNAEHLLLAAKNKKTPIKAFIMSNNVVVGVGNIYATESLFHAGIHPLKPACDLTLNKWQELVKQIQKVLTIAIENGGTTLKDFINIDGKPGYFKQKLAAYGRSGKPCIKCHHILCSIKQQGRTTVFCKHCQNF